MQFLDWVALIAFFLVMVGIGFNAYKRISGSKDFYVAGGGLPWWLAGVSHHVSGYSGVVFTGYAAIAYATGFNLYIWWALNVALACFVGAWLVVPRWARLRNALNIQSPTEYLKMRYDVKTQQVIAWLGVLLKLLDTAGKYAAIGLLLYGFAGVPIHYGIMIAGIVAMLYVTVGGLWADTMNDFFQFIVQVAAGLAMFFIIQNQLGSIGTDYFTMWDQLPIGNGDWFNDKYTPAFFICFSLVIFLSYTGGTWNLASRFIASPNGSHARKAMFLSSALYIIWPLILFAPMWAAPLLIPDLASGEQTQIYSMLTVKYLPAGFVGIVLASMFAATLSMVASDANAISSVLSRDILPLFSKKFKNENGETPLKVARIVTFTFTLVTIFIALNKDHFGGIIGLILVWFGGLIGPASIPMVLGLLPFYKHCGSKSALGSMAVGLSVFVGTKLFITDPSMALSIGGPVICSLIFFSVAAVYNRRFALRPEIEELMVKLSKDEPEATLNLAESK
ncbi:Na+:solute symporter [Vibrio sp. SS-MA-C1-2]|uniref:sodium:solute symporter family protein n=1 Tax=Vibrio sp. SS-MA-C1-2 TaxID=2908646 RepID=UPI001F1A5C50|nr:sodium:solute symporter family protein [Vibrio sp. SS-MA-C1-2]UJF18274.1 Na+:solute symporter [Vibrio sp. SS-MA-C1-2]